MSAKQVIFYGQSTTEMTAALANNPEEINLDMCLAVRHDWFMVIRIGQRQAAHACINFQIT